MTSQSPAPTPRVIRRVAASREREYTRHDGHGTRPRGFGWESDVGGSPYPAPPLWNGASVLVGTMAGHVTLPKPCRNCSMTNCLVAGFQRKTISRLGALRRQRMASLDFRHPIAASGGAALHLNRGGFSYPAAGGQCERCCDAIRCRRQRSTCQIGVGPVHDMIMVSGGFIAGMMMIAIVMALAEIM
jgi:hypothetical protein